MQLEERRRVSRSRVVYGGTVVYNQRQSTLSCVVQNLSDAGAKIVLDNPTLLPDRVELVINRKGRAYAAEMIWCNGTQAGFAFAPHMPANGTVSLDWARRLRDCENDRKALRARINQLMSEH